MLKTDGKITKVCFEGNCFKIELALTQDEQAKGLMFREELARNEGMLFIFGKEQNRSFWMKNVLIPLDIIWLNKEKEAVLINKNVQPCNADNCQPIYSEKPVQYFLEINADTADKIGLEIGSKMSIY